MACELDWICSGDDPEIQLRIRPLREQWEARGPGMLAFLAHKISWIELPDRFIVNLAKPGTGVRGEVIASDRIQFEAFLANPLAQLPEVVRLVWLCTCAVVVESHQNKRVSAALIPPAVEAAEYVELASLDAVAISLALENWFVPSPNLRGGQLLDWWDHLSASTYTDKAAWLHAVKKLDPLRP